MNLASRAYRVVAFLFLFLVLAQVFSAGLGVFGVSSLAPHAALGYGVVLVSLISLTLALLTRQPARARRLSAATALLTLMQPVLIFVRGEYPLVTALHPVNALLIFALAIEVSRNRVTAPPV